MTPPISELAEDFKDPRSEAAGATPMPEATVATPTVVVKKKATEKIKVRLEQVDPKPSVNLVAKAKCGWVAKDKARCYSFACN